MSGHGLTRIQLAAANGYLDDLDAITAFRAAMREHGLDPDADLVADDKIHRFHVQGDRRGRRAGWYVVHLDGRPAGAFGSWKTGLRVTWSLEGPRTMTPEERAALRRQIREQRVRREAEERRRHEDAAQEAARIWAGATPATTHPYLRRKRVKPHGTRIGTWRGIPGTLIIPIMDAGRIVSLQAIFAERGEGGRDKDFLPGGRKRGCYFRIGPKPTASDTVVIAEGFATAATIHEATGLTVFAAFDAGNLEPVAKALCARFPDVQFIIAADNDQWTTHPDGTPWNPGIEYATAAARAVGGRVVVPAFPPDDSDRRTDFNDLAARDGLVAVRAAFAERAPASPLAEAAKSGEREPGAEPGHDSSGEGGGQAPWAQQAAIDVTDYDLPSVAAQAWRALRAWNEPPTLLRSAGGLLVRVERDERNRIVTVPLNDHRMRYALARAATWVIRKKGLLEPTRPPLDVVHDLLAHPEPPLPALRRVTDVPTFAPDGRLITDPGHDAASGIYYAPDPRVSVPPVPERPTPADVADARDVIMDLLFDFPFATAADGTNAVGLPVAGVARDLIAGATPLNLFEASTPASGKGLLSDVLLSVPFGDQVGALPEATNEEELRKRLTSLLVAGVPAARLDNLNRPLTSASLATALTEPLWTDRVLGRSEMVRLPIRLLWVATGNNVAISDEIARRTVRIRLDPGVERPWLRTGFRHPDLRTWAAEHRGRLLWAFLVLVQSWLAAGRPAWKGRVLGSYESWSRVIGGILAHAGYRDFLGNADVFYEAADLESGIWRRFFSAWWDRFGSTEVGVSDLLPLAQATDGLALRGETDRAQRTSLGSQLRRRRERVYGTWRLVPGRVEHSTQRWRLAPTRPSGAKEPPGEQAA